MLRERIQAVGPKDGVGTLNVFAGVGHLANKIAFLVTIHCFREKIKDLLNYFVAVSSSANTLLATTTMNQKSLKENKKSRQSISLGFRSMAWLIWLVTLVVSIHTTGIIDRYVFQGITPFGEEDGEIFGFLKHTSFDFGVARVFWRIGVGFLIVGHYMLRFQGGFILGMGVVVALTMKCISSHLTSYLNRPDQHLKPANVSSGLKNIFCVDLTRS